MQPDVALCPEPGHLVSRQRSATFTKSIGIHSLRTWAAADTPPKGLRELTQGFPAFARAQDAGTRGPAEGQVPVVFAWLIPTVAWVRSCRRSRPSGAA